MRLGNNTQEKRKREREWLKQSILITILLVVSSFFELELVTIVFYVSS